MTKSLDLMVEYYNRPHEMDQLDIVLQLSVYTFVLLKLLIFHISNIFIEI